MAGSAKKVEQQQKRRELNEKAVAFYAQHNVTKTVEKLLNEMFVAAPKDVYGYMAEYFSDLAVAPVICGGRCVGGMDERGGRALDVSIHCTVHGVDKHVTSVSVPVNPHPPPPPSPPTNTSPTKPKGKKGAAAESVPSEQEVEEKREEDDTADPFESFNTHIIPALVSRSPNQQAEIDRIITHLKDKDGRELHPASILATSCVVANSAALLSSRPLYKYLTNTLLPSSPPTPPSSRSLPTPVTSLLAGGCGKLRVREFCIIPLPGRVFSEQVTALSSMYQSLGTLLSAKTGLAGGATPVTGSSGAYCPTLDKLEAGMELVKDAATHSGLVLGEDVSVLIDVGADRLFDQEKCKYELIAGQWKTSHEVATIYADLLTSHIGLMGYIDPLHHKDVEGWKNLQEMLGSKCLLVADRTLAAGLPLSLRRGHSKSVAESDQEEMTVSGDGGLENGLEWLSCASLTLESTLWATFERAVSIRVVRIACSVCRQKQMPSSANYIMLRAPPILTVNPLLVDLAVAMQCVLFRVGAPFGLTNTCLLSRMLQIKEELCDKGTYEPAKALVFSCQPLSALDQQPYLHTCMY